MFGGGLNKLTSAFGDRGTRAMLGAQMMAAPNNRAAFGTLGAGVALSMDQQRELAERKEKIDYLRSLSNTNPQMIGAVEAGVMSPMDAYKSMTTPVQSPERKYAEDATGRKRYIDNGDYVFNNVEKSRKAPTVKNVKQADGSELAVQWDDVNGEWVPINAPMGGNNIQPMKKLTETQAKANIYASRMENSNQILEALETEGTDLSNKIMAGVPVLGNYALSPEYRRYDQAKRDFINATLRQESGAVIAESEFKNAEIQYFPQPGDDPETIAQKQENRRIAMEQIRRASSLPATEPTFQQGQEMPDFSTMSDEELEAIVNGR